jgi:hypothetical protein
MELIPTTAKKCGFLVYMSDIKLDLAERLERLAVNAKVATVLGSIPASSDTVGTLRGGR